MNEREASQEIDNHRANVMKLQLKAAKFSDDELGAAYESAKHVQGGDNTWLYVLQFELCRRIRAEREAA